MQYSTADVSQLLGLSAHQIRTFVAARLVRPVRGARGQFLFRFQDLILLRAAAELRAARIPQRSILRNLKRLRDQLHGRELTEVRIAADGRQIIVHDGDAAWNPGSGQLLFDFDVAELAVQAEPIARKRFNVARDYSAVEWFELGVELEVVAPVQARIAYTRALEADPRHADAHVNLGRLLHEDAHATEAATHYLQALQIDAANATAAFNLGVAMEDLGRGSEAMKAYQQAIAADPGFADAHYNLAGLMEKLGDKRGAIRHLSRYRKLYGPTL
jgi:tetratricopeptide (TPR) repeat protein